MTNLIVTLNDQRTSCFEDISAFSMDEIQVRIDSYISQKVRSGSNCVAVVGYDKH